jgi:hypothetical protein
VTSNRQGVGARIAVTCEGPEGLRTIHRAAGSISSFGQAPRRQEIGLGRATAIRAIEVWWPASGERRRFEQVPLDAHLRITEGVAEPELLPSRHVPLKAPAA